MLSAPCLLLSTGTRTQQRLSPCCSPTTCSTRPRHSVCKLPWLREGMREQPQGGQKEEVPGRHTPPGGHLPSTRRLVRRMVRKRAISTTTSEAGGGQASHTAPHPRWKVPLDTGAHAAPVRPSARCRPCMIHRCLRPRGAAQRAARSCCSLPGDLPVETWRGLSEARP